MMVRRCMSGTKSSAAADMATAGTRGACKQGNLSAAGLRSHEEWGCSELHDAHLHNRHARGSRRHQEGRSRGERCQEQCGSEHGTRCSAIAARSKLPETGQKETGQLGQ
jgi:hypothetical protein